MPDKKTRIRQPSVVEVKDVAKIITYKVCIPAKLSCSDILNVSIKSIENLSRKLVGERPTINTASRYNIVQFSKDQ